MKKLLFVLSLFFCANAYAGLTVTENVTLGNVSNTELQYLDGVTSSIQTQLDAKQAADADLTTLSGPTAWRMFYSNGTAINELALGSANQILRSSGTTSAPTWIDQTSGAGYEFGANNFNGTGNFTTTGNISASGLSVAGNTSGALKLLETGSTPSYYATLQAGDQSGNATLTLPATTGTLALNTGVSTGAAGLCPQLNGNTSTFLNGNGSWTAPAGGTATPAGTGTEIQYRLNATSLGAVGNSTYNSTTEGVSFKRLEATTAFYKDSDGDFFYNLTGAGNNLTYNVTVNLPVANGTLMVGDDSAYNATAWDTDTSAPSKNAIRDKIEALPGGHDAVTITDTATVDLSLSGQNISAAVLPAGIDLNLANWTNVNATNLKTGTVTQAYDADLTTWAGVTSSANGRSLVSAADYAAMRGLLDLEAGTDFYNTSASDTRYFNASNTNAGDIGLAYQGTKRWHIGITNPSGINTTGVIPIGVADANMTFTRVAAGTSNASYEIAGDFKWADARIGLANATVINDFDTTSGVRTDTTITAENVTSGKFLYLILDSAPNANMTDCYIDIDGYYR